jgi:hypothetical protein
MAIIPATWEEEVGGSWSEASLGKWKRPYLKKKLKAKGLGAWFRWCKALNSIPIT